MRATGGKPPEAPALSWRHNRDDPARRLRDGKAPPRPSSLGRGGTHDSLLAELTEVAVRTSGATTCCKGPGRAATHPGRPPRCVTRDEAGPCVPPWAKGGWQLGPRRGPRARAANARDGLCDPDDHSASKPSRAAAKVTRGGRPARHGCRCRARDSASRVRRRPAPRGRAHRRARRRERPRHRPVVPGRAAARRDPATTGCASTFHTGSSSGEHGHRITTCPTRGIGRTGRRHRTNARRTLAARAHAIGDGHRPIDHPIAAAMMPQPCPSCPRPGRAARRSRCTPASR